MTFHYDWFSPIRETMIRFTDPAYKHILEIGSFEGRSTLFFGEQCPNAQIVCVDHFKGGEDQQDLNLDNLRQRFLSNIADIQSRLTIREGNSWDVLPQLPSSFFNLVFVDGSHVAGDVLNDLVHAYRCVRDGGRIIADDYSWENQRSDCPRVAIDAFVKCFQGRIRVKHIDRVIVMDKVC